MAVTLGNPAKEEKVVDNTANQRIKIRYIGDLRKGPSHLYGLKLQPQEEYILPFYIAEHALKEPELFELAEDTPIAQKVMANIKKQRGG